MTLGWVVDGKKTPRWVTGGNDPPRPLISFIASERKLSVVFSQEKKMK
jgi:hypothetical protein